MSLATKYRPQDFDTVVEQKHISDILKAQIIEGTHGNNYIFFGARGTGKTTTARIVAKALNCINTRDGNPDNSCEHCLMINEGKTFDVIEIDAASHTGVDNVREEIIAKATYQPANLRKKVYIIDEVHMLSKGAFNALLKIMEEPPEYLIFILATTEINKIPETIISRCQIFNFKKIHITENIARLKEICIQEKLSYTDEGLEIIAKLSEGCMRDSIKYLDQVSVLGDVNLTNCVQFLGVSSTHHIADFLEALKHKSSTKAIQKLAEFQENGIQLSVLAKQILDYIDEHLHEDTAFLLSVFEMIKTIISQSKIFPDPYLLYKTEIMKYFSSGDTSETTPAEGTKQVSAATKPVEKIPEPVKKQQEQGIEPEKKTKELSADDLQAQMLEKITSKSLKMQLESSSKITNYDGNKADIVIINSMLYEKVKQSETLTILEEILEKIVGKKIILTPSFMSKEDFVATMM
ncbi:MAG TPA: DNA polymerase III subunit gamma/tau [Candidatus Absconditabacterales bacterium]|nr:DNA polymerase III subunit gamma/tau [Candidatus Absconditabacterales bacterium]HMT27192.1 DNA polymerase III subunit gamma/tau [Candidatus Absconditabacterales bacterium]